MSGILAGARIVELAQSIFVPSAGALLADLGADVIKIEHPRQGDPARGLSSSGFRHSGIGRENGRFGLEEHTELQVVMWPN